MSVKVHEAFSIDSFQDRLLWWDDFLGDQVKDEWFDTIVGLGTNAVVDAQTGGIVRLTTGAVTNDNNILNWQNYRSLLVTKKVTMEIRLKLNATTYEEARISLYNIFNDQIYFRYNEPAGGGPNNWYIRCLAGGVSTLLDSGVAADTNYHIFRIECFPTDEVHFYIDGVETANSPIVTNITALYLQPLLLIHTLEDVAKSMDADYCVVRQEI